MDRLLKGNLNDCRVLVVCFVVVESHKRLRHHLVHRQLFLIIQFERRLEVDLFKLKWLRVCIILVWESEAPDRAL